MCLSLAIRKLHQCGHLQAYLDVNCIGTVAICGGHSRRHSLTPSLDSLDGFFAAVKTEPTETPSFRAITRDEAPRAHFDTICATSMGFLGRPSRFPFARAWRRPARTLSTSDSATSSVY